MLRSDRGWICPLEYRYGSLEMKKIFSRENLIEKEVFVEKTLLKTLVEIGFAPRKCLDYIDKCFENIRIDEIDDLEKKTGHDTASLAIVIAEKCGDCGKYVHLGATSNDIIDTAWARVLRDALIVLKNKLKKVIELLIDYSMKYRDVLMIGRTHGQHALPITLGFKLANYVYEFTRSYDRICSMESRVIRGKMSGGVGSMAGWMGRGLDIERVFMNEIGLKPHLITTQVSPRDSFAEIIVNLAILASQLDRFALEIRELSRPEIGEVIVKTSAGSIGSSTMPHKRNPVLAERICGLARLIRGFTVPALENIVLMHERDLCNSSVERVMIPHVFLILDQMLEDTLMILRNIEFNTERMRENISLTRNIIASECIMIKLVVKSNIARHVAHRLLSELVDKALSENRDFREVVSESNISELLSQSDINDCFDYNKYLGNINELIERAIEYSREILKVC
ncbi:MAG: adenylosuccinate lyase [Desulfurococcaceae archaeon]